MRAVAVVVTLAAACAMPMPAPQPARTTPPPATSAVAAIEQDVFAEINRIRARQGAPALRRDGALDAAARSHSVELARRGALDHNSTDPALRTPGMRATAAGFTWSRIAENLAAMSGAATSVGQQTGAIWLDSPGHRSNLTNAEYTHTGVGVAVNSRGVWYVTQLYAVPRSTR